MIAQAVFLAQFATLMLAVGAIPFLPESSILPVLGALVGTAILATAAPRLLGRILGSARIPVPLPRRRSGQTGRSPRISLPTDPGRAGSPQPRAPSGVLGVHA
ncbi:hypothetical protein JD292_04430 [Leucobacter sp. CSA2]|uniref:Uncharacterized protein n=1 Tax=Leucobacter edaphi TaxID=2796472 RepID=A0A934QAT5_9MICO|nr:hypothetical protein [Leucobacter edaphi]MBK0421320.1 hypothetical protein [Leucobacter edaphi]